MFFLVYHRVLPGGSSALDFYDTSEDQLERQLQTIIDVGWTIGDPRCLDSRADLPAQSVFLTFDDGTTDHFNYAAPLLERHNTRAVFFVCTEKLDRPGYLRADEAQTLHKLGHLLGSHGHTHRRMDKLPDGEVTRELRTSRDCLTRLTGAPILHFAPSGGFYNSAVLRSCWQEGFRFIRTMDWGECRTWPAALLPVIPVNSLLTPARLASLLQGRWIPWLPFLHHGKNALRRVLPASAYLQLRRCSSRIFRSSRQHSQLRRPI